MLRTVNSVHHQEFFTAHTTDLYDIMIVKKKQLQETVHRTLLLGCFYLLYML